MAEDGESLGVVRGIDPGLECYTIRGLEFESLGHLSSCSSQIAAAPRITMARTADAMSSQRVCMATEGNRRSH